MTELARWATETVQKRQSRRGFLATCGKVALGRGAAMMGAGYRTGRVSAAPCCTGYPVCGSIPGTPACGATAGCPAGCPGGAPHLCCDTVTHSTHSCYVCNCLPGTCLCEYDIMIPSWELWSGPVQIEVVGQPVTTVSYTPGGTHWGAPGSWSSVIKLVGC